jgi:hypothetical protein
MHGLKLLRSHISIFDECCCIIPSYSSKLKGMGGMGESMPLELAIKLALIINFSKVGPN